MHRSSVTWGTIIIFGWIWVTSWVLFHHYIPGSWWLEVHKVEIRDSEVGQTPQMAVSRTIRRPVYGTWQVTVLRQGMSGFYIYCVAHGSTDYRPNLGIPDAPDLDWWTWPTQCPLAAGEYTVNTLWRIQPEGYPIKEIRVSSNVFKVSKGANVNGND